MSSSHSCINHEPEVTAMNEEASVEESNGEDGEEGDDNDVGGNGDEGGGGDEGDEEKKDIQGGHHQAKSMTEGKSYFISCFIFLLSVLDVKSTGHHHLAEGFFFSFSYFSDLSLILLYFLDIDISNLASPERQAPAYGSSWSTGGILHGHAVGNTFNIGDPSGDVLQDVAPLSHGWINITIVQQPPSAAVIENPTLHLNVKSPCYETLGPLLKKVMKSYSPVCSKYLIIYKYTRHITSTSPCPTDSCRNGVIPLESAGMDRNPQEWHRNLQEWHRNLQEWTGIRRNGQESAGMDRNGTGVD